MAKTILDEKRKSGVLIYVILFLGICTAAYVGVRSLTKTSKEQQYEEKMELIINAGKKYAEQIQDRLSSRCFEITVSDLVKLDLVPADRNGKIYDPRTNESMNKKKLCLTYENNKIIVYEKNN